MARRRLKNSRREFAARQLEEELKLAKPSKPKPSISLEKFKIEVDKINTRLTNDDINSIQPAELVSLYAWCHEKTYGVIPEDLVSDQWDRARKAAATLVDESFDGNLERTILFFKWLWSRERGRLKWKLDKGYEITRISWWKVFVDKGLVTDYKVAELIHDKRTNRF